MTSNKRNFYDSIWSKYMPVIRILLKKSAAAEQVLSMNRIDFERAGSSRKSGYKFTIDFTNSRPDTIFTDNELVQSFVAALQDDEIIQQHLSQNDYTFTFSSKYQLQIKNNRLRNQTALPALAEEAVPDLVQ
jgi:hypothetical protein